jgi:hypothetical protein
VKILECGSGRDVRVGIAYLRVANVPAYVAYVFLYLLLLVFNSIFSRGTAYPMGYPMRCNKLSISRGTLWLFSDSLPGLLRKPCFFMPGRDGICQLVQGFEVFLER